MNKSSVWIVDQLAAARVIRELNLSVTESGINRLAELLADHRLDAMDLAISRTQLTISNAIRDLLGRNRHKSGEWSDGCRSAEMAILTDTLDAIQIMRPKQTRSKGQVLRSLMRQARKTDRLMTRTVSHT
ncbi:hypothetical protein [Sphingomonas sp. UYEF23]|uniref:hypothetical protein n=1 Tax=Sphingomonas sp. UYEF23 TaxID=1756408 RepID=UPI0033915A7A